MATCIAGSSRLFGVPRPLANEIARPRVLDRLEERWDRPVTMVRAGAGFGKSTALAQAVRRNRANPRGVDIWLGCQPNHRDPCQLAATLLAALGAGGSCTDAPRDLTTALGRFAPLHVCLVLDDVHELGDRSDSAHILGQVVGRLAPTAHIVLAGRTMPRLSLCRLRARGDVIEIDETDLLFAPAEVDALATRMGRPASGTHGLGGWPALVSLALTAGTTGPWDYLREEVLDHLSPDDLIGLASLASLGRADADEVAEVAGRSCDLDTLAAVLPLVVVLDDGRYRCHDLWKEGLPGVVPARTLAALRRRAVDVLVAADRLADAGQSAIDGQEWELLGEVAVELVRTTLSVIPVDLAESWLESVPAAFLSTPEFSLLRAAAAFGRDYRDRQVDAWLDEATVAFRARSSIDGAAAAAGLATIAAHSREDSARLATVAVEVAQLAASTERRPPLIDLLDRAVNAVVCELDGDPEQALEHLVLAPVDEVAEELALSVHRFWAHCLLMAGRADEAVAHAGAHLAESGDRHSRLMPVAARWASGDPAGFAELSEPPDDPSMGDRDTYLERTFGAITRSSGSAGDVELNGPRPELFDNSRDAALATCAKAAVAVANHDEQGAATAYTEQLARFGLADRLGERHLRRFLALGYVLSPEVRRHWDTVPLGPSHRRLRAIARALLNARAGCLPQIDLDPPQVFCAFPLPWSIELACRLASLGSPTGQALTTWLSDFVGPAVSDELRRLAETSPPAVSTGARQLLSVLPLRPAAPIWIGVMGQMEITSEGVPCRNRELRRVRVRQLLGALVLNRTMTRAQIVDILWPDLDLAAGQRNLRVTLTYLRRLLEPDRSTGEASYNLRVSRETVSLLESPTISVDLWRFDALVDAAQEADRQGDSHQAATLLDAAVRLWRGRPLEELLSVPEMEPAIERIALRQLDALLTLGELRLVEGRHHDAATCAHGAIAIQLYDERAHRLNLAASIQRGETTAIDRALTRLDRMLAELGVEAHEATELLRHEAIRRRIV